MKSGEERSRQGVGMCKGPGISPAEAPRAPGVPGGERRVFLVRKAGEIPGASPRVFNPMKRDRRFIRVVSWCHLGKTMGSNQRQGGALVHGFGGGTGAEPPS